MVAHGTFPNGREVARLGTMGPPLASRRGVRTSRQRDPLASRTERRARPQRPAVTGWCDRRKVRTWSIVFSSKSFGSLQGNTVD